MSEQEACASFFAVVEYERVTVTHSSLFDYEEEDFTQETHMTRNGAVQLFTSEESAAEWMRTNGYRTLEQYREEEIALLVQRNEAEQVWHEREMVKYRRALTRYENDCAKVQQLRSQGVSSRIASKPLAPVEPDPLHLVPETMPEDWRPRSYCAVVPATVVA